MRFCRQVACAVLSALLAAVGGCRAQASVVNPRGMSYGVERHGRAFGALALVEAARGTRRTAHEVLFDGTAAPTLDPAPDGVEGGVIIMGLPRGDGLAIVDGEGFVRDASLLVVEACVDDLRRQGFDVRLDRGSTLALPPQGVSPRLRLAIWLDDIVVHRSKGHVEATTRVRVWSRQSAEERERHEDVQDKSRLDEPVHAREDNEPYDILSALGGAIAKRISTQLAPHDDRHRAGPPPR